MMTHLVLMVTRNVGLAVCPPTYPEMTPGRKPPTNRQPSLNRKVDSMMLMWMRGPRLKEKLMVNAVYN